MIWAKEETMPRSEIEALQLERLQYRVKYAYERVPYYKAKMDEKHVKPSDIKTLSDVTKLPFVTKQDFRDTYPFGMFAVPKNELVRIHASSGTTGKPTVVGYTADDMEYWIESVARVACMGGAEPDDIAQICFGYGMFTGALGLHEGLTKVGLAVIPASVGNSKRQLMYMQDMGTTLLVATPSYAMHLAELIIEQGIDPAKDLHVRTALCGGEGMSEGLRRDLQKAWGPQLRATQNYGMSELNGPGVSGECLELCGMHINEDFFLAEVIDPETGEPVPDGEPGELVITCLMKEALPLIRYRTRDLTVLHKEPCACGRTTARMESLSGRADDMLIIRGVNVFPSHIEEVLGTFEAIGPHYQIVLGTKGYLDTALIQVELADSSLLDSYARMDKLEREISGRLRQALGLDCKIRLEAPGTLPRFEGKARRVIDNRTPRPGV